MALCSTAFNNRAIKRSCSAVDSSSNKKRICLKNYRFPGADANTATAVSPYKNGADSSSDDDEDSDDENLNYRLHQIRAKRRASSRISFSLNPNLELSKYISKYSDEDEEDNNTDGSNRPRNKSICHAGQYDFRRNSVLGNQVVDDEELVTRRGNLSEGKSINLCQDLEQELLNSTKKQTPHSRSNSFDDFKIIQVPKSDHMARARCFDYLVGSIDEAWARYCDATSCIEDEVFYSDENTGKRNAGVKQSYQSTANVDDSDFEQHSNHPDNHDDDVIDNYSVNSTDLTDISDNYLSVKCRNSHGNSTPNTMNKPSYLSLSSSAYSDTTSSKPSNTNQYQKLKDRLTKAKYYLQDLIDSDDYQDIQNFWNRWDMIKYVTIELVEDDDDSDEVLESTIEELEAGRYYVN